MRRASSSSMVTSGFDLFSQDGTGSRIYVMDLIACRTSHRLVSVVVFRCIFGGKPLNAVSGYGAAVHEKRHWSKSPGLDGAEGATPGSSA